MWLQMQALPLLMLFFKSKVAPMAISPIGVAILPMLVTAFAGIPAYGRPIADHRSPATIPKIIGLVTIPLNVFFEHCPVYAVLPRLEK